MNMKASHIALLGVGAAYLISRSRKDEGSEYEFDEEDYMDNVVVFPSDFDPTAFEFSPSDYSGARSKARRRDRKGRRSKRIWAKYDKCVAKKGKNHRRCQRLKRRAEKLQAKADALQAKLEAKGAAEARDWSQLGPAAIAGAKAALPEQAELIDELVAELGPEEDYFEEEEIAVAPPSNVPLIVGGVALVGIGGFILFRLTRK
jgi:hypothetical protein